MSFHVFFVFFRLVFKPKEASGVAVYSVLAVMDMTS